MKISDAARNAMVDALVDLLDAGSGAATLAFRTGTAPASLGTAETGTLLATCTFSDPAFGSSASGTATANAITSDTNVDASGTPGYFRAKDSDGTAVFQGSVGLSASDINFDSVTWVAGGTVSVTSLTVTQPAGS
jgi:hypothetical protein